MVKLAKWALLGLVPLVWGCSSAPIHYHTLLPAQPATASGDVRVERVSMPPQVDRSQIVVRQGGSGLSILETEWWGANLMDEFQSALQDQLGAPLGKGATSLRVDVQRFDSVPGQYSLLDARWRLSAGGDRSLSCRSVLQTRADASVEGLVNAHQSNLRQLAQAIRQARSSGRCP